MTEFMIGAYITGALVSFWLERSAELQSEPQRKPDNVRIAIIAAFWFLLLAGAGVVYLAAIAARAFGGETGR